MSQREEARRRGRLQVLDAALTEFLDKGLGGASTRAIAARAGVAQATAFHHFASKQAMYDALVELGAEHIRLDLDAALDDPYAALAAVVTDNLEMLRTNPRAAQVFVFMSRAERDSEAAQEAGRRALAETAQLIAAAQQRGQVRPGDPRALAVALWGALQGIAEILSSDPTQPVPEESWLLDLLVP